MAMSVWRMALVSGGFAAALAAWFAGQSLSAADGLELTTAYERYRRSPICGEGEISFKAPLYLRLSMPRSVSESLASVRLYADGREVAAARIERDAYVYPSLFGREAYAETRRTFCGPLSCSFGMSFYWKEAGVSPGTVSVAAEGYSASGERIYAASAPPTLLPSEDDARSRRHDEAFLRLDPDGWLVGTVDLERGADISRTTLLLQWRDASGYREKEVAVREGRNVASAVMTGSLSYAGFLVWRGPPAGGAASSEDKVELFDAADPLYACMAGRDGFSALNPGARRDGGGE
jgi:hypothetical protein